MQAVRKLHGPAPRETTPRPRSVERRQISRSFVPQAIASPASPSTHAAVVAGLAACAVAVALMLATAPTCTADQADNAIMIGSVMRVAGC